jgi:amino acid transporter
MALEGISILAMIALSVVVLAKVFEGHGPIGDPRIRMVFVPPEGVGVVAIALGLGFGFLSYAGFEESATLGEEVNRASRTIPRVLILTVLTAGIACTVISAAEVLGFGLSPADMTRFTSSTSLLGDLATIYAGHGVGDVFDVFAMLSALSAGLASAAASSRIIYALLRDYAPDSRLGQIETGTGTPRNAALMVLAVGLLGYETMRQVFRASASDAFFWASTLAALAILLVYLLVSISAGSSVVRTDTGARRSVLLVPVAAVAATSYTLWVNVFPVQPGAYAVLPWVVIGWISVAAVAVVVLPRVDPDRWRSHDSR